MQFLNSLKQNIRNLRENMWKPENRIPTLLSILLLAALVSFGVFVVVSSFNFTMMVLGIFVAIGGAIILIQEDKDTSYKGNIIILLITGIIFNGSIVRGLYALITFTILAVIIIGGKWILRNKPSYIVPFLLIATLISSWVGSSIVNPEGLVYGKENKEVITREELFVPVFFSNLEENYIAKEKLPAQKVQTKFEISFPNLTIEAEGKIGVEIIPLDTETYQKLSDKKLKSLSVSASGIKDFKEKLTENAKGEILKKLQTSSDKVKIKLSGTPRFKNSLPLERPVS